jgi:hypothetical protein
VTVTIVSWIADFAYGFPALLAIILVRQVIFGRNWPIIGSGYPQMPKRHSSASTNASSFFTSPRKMRAAGATNQGSCYCQEHDAVIRRIYVDYALF